MEHNRLCDQYRYIRPKLLGQTVGVGLVVLLRTMGNSHHSGYVGMLHSPEPMGSVCCELFWGGPVRYRFRGCSLNLFNFSPKSVKSILFIGETLPLSGKTLLWGIKSGCDGHITATHVNTLHYDFLKYHCSCKN